MELIAFDPSQKKKKAAAAVSLDKSLNDIDFGLKKKKKKKKAPVVVHQVIAPSILEVVDEKDYDYFELLAKVHKLLGNDAARGTKKSNVNLPSLEIKMIGTTVTLWSNIVVMSQKLNRDVEHLKQYALSELATTGTFDGKQALKISGRVRLQQLESIVRHYCNDYVVCKYCKSYNTTLTKRKFRGEKTSLISCQDCHTERVQQTINDGFRAATKKTRRAERKNQ